MHIANSVPHFFFKYLKIPSIIRTILKAKHGNP